MTEQELIDYCLTLEGAFKRYPFGGYPSRENPLIMTVRETKIFCAIYEGTQPLHFIVKCDPFEAERLRATYAGVKPGYHFNKKHWNSVYLDGTVPDEEIRRMVRNSYMLVMGMKKK